MRNAVRVLLFLQLSTALTSAQAKDTATLPEPWGTLPCEGRTRPLQHLR